MQTETQTIHGQAFSRKWALIACELLDQMAIEPWRRERRIGRLSPRQWTFALTFTDFASADFDEEFAEEAGIEPRHTRDWCGVTWVRTDEVEGAGTPEATCTVAEQFGIVRLNVVNLVLDDTANIGAFNA